MVAAAEAEGADPPKDEEDARTTFQGEASRVVCTVASDALR